MNNKNQLRITFKTIRSSLSLYEKNSFDSRIFTFLINSEQYKNSDLILIYVSFNSEVDTINIIKHALSNSKKVAVPYCQGNEMNFIEINSLDDLSDGKYGIPTVNPDASKIITEFNSSTLCIAPGLSFDKYGNRLGYGGGFYDRFLCKNPVNTIGLCYERCFSTKIPCEKFDIKMKYILTECGFKNIAKGDN